VRIGVGKHADKGRAIGHVLGNFSKADEQWLVPMLSAIAEATPLLVKDDDVGFMNKVVLLTNPPKPKPEKKDKE
jgi:PTH1 family peptidyl-tRNA hydrolase